MSDEPSCYVCGSVPIVVTAPWGHNFCRAHAYLADR